MLICRKSSMPKVKRHKLWPVSNWALIVQSYLQWITLTEPGCVEIIASKWFVLFFCSYKITGLLLYVLFVCIRRVIISSRWISIPWYTSLRTRDENTAVTFIDLTAVCQMKTLFHLQRQDADDGGCSILRRARVHWQTAMCCSGTQLSLYISTLADCCRCLHWLEWCCGARGWIGGQRDQAS